jgi:RNA recognition motif-containing protein
MSTILHVDHLPFSVTDNALESLFSRVGQVVSCDVVLHGTTRISKAIGFVEMKSAGDARKAIAQLDGKKLDGRPIRIAEVT